MDNVLLAFALTTLAGLASGVGGLIVLFSKKGNLKFLSICLSFAAGVMIYISFVEIFAKSLEHLEYYEDGFENYYLWATVAFFGGIALIALIDRFIPHDDKSNEYTDNKKPNESQLKRTGLLSALALAIHNFPEGIVVFMATLADPYLGVAIAIAISIHNIPEGIAVASPIYYATGSKLKAFWYALLAGLSEPIGALIAYFLLMGIFTDAVLGISFAAVGGIMIFISFHQLLPSAQKFADHHTVMKALFFGMLIMALSLVLLEL